MADPNGKEAGEAFLVENKGKNGVITLPSGLQYRVLETGAGMEHPTVGTPCECHYAGRLLDGTEFDSSYKRGAPTTFAPNQVIKGWTEAMQLMVQGDKWEMYIPYQLAYGAAGKPPKIPAAACLVFIMEIVKIKGPTKKKAMVYPEWTAEDLEFWTEKDETACKTWEEGRVKRWEEGDEKLTKKFPTREALDAENAKVSLDSKNKSLWKRTTAKQKAAAAGGAPPAPKKEPEPAKPEKVTLDKTSARALLDRALEAFKEPANKAKLTALTAVNPPARPPPPCPPAQLRPPTHRRRCAQHRPNAPPLSLQECNEAGENAGMMRMMKLAPAVQEMMGPALKEYGYEAEELLSVAMQVQMLGTEDPTIGADVGKLMKAVQGDISGLV